MSALASATRSSDQCTDDRDLVAGVRARDDRAFEQLYARYEPRIAAYVRGMVHDHGRAEDITQEVFISALRRVRETDRDIAFKPWIYEIAKNACIDAFRRTRHHNEVSFDAHDALGAADHGRLAEPGPTPDSAVDAKVAIDNLCGAFGGLSQAHHEILVMRELEGLSYREIGERLGMNRSSVESMLFRARRRLSEEYGELVSGERCLRVQRIVDAGQAQTVGLRDRRRMARHLAHCQPCRRYAGRASLDLDRPLPLVASKIAAWLPLPLFVRRRFDDEAGQMLGPHGATPVAQWSANVAAVLDPGIVASWSKAVATAAAVAVTGMGAGAAISKRQPPVSLGVHGAAAGLTMSSLVGGGDDGDARGAGGRLQGAPRHHAGADARQDAGAATATTAPPAAAVRGEAGAKEPGATAVGTPSVGDAIPGQATPAAVHGTAAPRAGEQLENAVDDLRRPAAATPGGVGARGGGAVEAPALAKPLGPVLDGVSGVGGPRAAAPPAVSPAPVPAVPPAVVGGAAGAVPSPTGVAGTVAPTVSAPLNSTATTLTRP